MFLILFYSLFTLLSFLLSYLGLPLTRLTYLLITLISIVIVYIINRLQRLQSERTQRSRVPEGEPVVRVRETVNAKAILLLIPPLLLFLLLSRGLSSALTPPHNADAGNHFFMISRILETQSVNYTRVYEGFSLPSWYPLGLQNFVAGILSIIGTTDLIKFVFPIIILIASFISYAIYRFSLQVTHHFPTALIASFLSLTFFMFPYNTFSWGGWSIMVGFILLFSALTETLNLLSGLPAIAAGLPAEKAGRSSTAKMSNELPSQKNNAKPVSLFSIFPLLLILNALFLTHTTEIIFYFLLSLPAFIIHRQTTLTLIKRFWWLGLINLGLLTPLVFAGFNRLQAQTLAPIIIPHYSVNDLLQMLSDFQIATTGNWLYSFLFIAGLGFLAWKKQKLFLVINTLTIFSLFFIVVLTPYLDPLSRRLFPLLESERLYYLLSPYYSLITAIILRLIYRRLKPIPLKIALTVVLLILTLPQFTRILHNLQFIASSYSPASNSDLRLIQKNANVCPVYLNEPVNDAGRFIPYLSTSKVIFHGPSELLPDYQERLSLIELVASEAAYPKLQEMMVKHPFDCIYAGAYTVHPLTPRLRLPMMLSNPYLTVLDSENGSYIFTLKQNDHLAEPLTPLTILPTDAYALKAHFIGDLGELEYSTENVPYRSVGQHLDLYTQEKLNTITLSGQSYASTLSCQVLINDQFHQNLQFTDKHSDQTIDKLKLTGHQTKISLICPDSPAFIFTKITLE